MFKPQSNLTLLTNDRNSQNLSDNLKECIILHILYRAIILPVSNNILLKNDGSVGQR